MTLTRANLDTFTAVVDTILPAVDGDSAAWTTPGGALGLADRLPAIFASLPHETDRKEFKQLLGLLDSRFGGVALFGRPRRFSAMSATARADAYRAMESSRLGLVRNGARALKTLAAFLWVTTDDTARRPLAWETMGYPGPNGAPTPTPKPMMALSVPEKMMHLSFAL